MSVKCINVNMKRTTPFQCFRKLLLQTDYRNVNVKETTENEPDKADTILRGTENEADAIVTLPGTW